MSPVFEEIFAVQVGETGGNSKMMVPLQRVKAPLQKTKGGLGESARRGGGGEKVA